MRYYMGFEVAISSKVSSSLTSEKKEETATCERMENSQRKYEKDEFLRFFKILFIS